MRLLATQHVAQAHATPAGARPWRRLARQPDFWIGLGLLLFLILFSFYGPVVWRRSAAYDVAAMLKAPGPGFPLGADALGRDNLWELMLGGRLPIITGFVTAIVATGLGVVAGLLAAMERTLEGPLMRTADAVLSIPQIIPIIIVQSLFGQNVYTLMSIVALTLWPSTARLVWTRVILVREMPYVEAATAEGLTRTQVLARHILPNSFDTIAACFATQFGSSVLFIALATAFGVGLFPATNWPSMIGASLQYISYNDWWLILPPGILCAALIISVFSMMEGLRRAMSPRLGRGAAIR